MTQPVSMPALSSGPCQVTSNHCPRPPPRPCLARARNGVHRDVLYRFQAEVLRARTQPTHALLVVQHRCKVVHKDQRLAANSYHNRIPFRELGTGQEIAIGAERHPVNPGISNGWRFARRAVRWLDPQPHRSVPSPLARACRRG